MYKWHPQHQYFWAQDGILEHGANGQLAAYCCVIGRGFEYIYAVESIFYVRVLKCAVGDVGIVSVESGAESTCVPTSVNVGIIEIRENTPRRWT